MSGVNNWAGLSGGGGGESKSNSSGAILLLVLFAGVCCCMLVCGLGGWYAYSQGWLDDLFKKEEETQAPTPPDDDETVPEDPEDPDTPPEQANQIGILNNTGKRHACNQPWVRPYLKYDDKGMNPKCCTAKDAGYQWNNCQAGDVLEVPSEFPVATLHDNARRIGKDRVQGGKLKRGKCPAASVGAGIGDNAIWYKEMNKSGNVQQVWCHPLKTSGSYAIGTGYAFYPACYKDRYKEIPADSGVYADKNAEKCTKNSGVVLWRERTNKVFGGINNRFKYVQGGG